MLTEILAGDCEGRATTQGCSTERLCWMRLRDTAGGKTEVGGGEGERRRDFQALQADRMEEKKQRSKQMVECCGLCLMVLSQNSLNIQ